MQYKYLIIESEQATIESIKENFRKFENYKCVGVSSCFNESLDMILTYSPNIIFINVDASQYNYSSAFNFVNELYKYLTELPFLIALSSTKEHAYNCMKNNFFDYLLKPINGFELRKTVTLLSKKRIEPSKKLCLKSYKDFRFIDIDEILFLKADNNATDFFMNDGSKVSAFKTLKYFESILPKNFTRIHNSYIVNKDYVSRIHFGKSKCTLKKNGYPIPFSKSYKSNVTSLEKSLSKKALLSLN